jgi:hypothetical protein
MEPKVLHKFGLGLCLMQPNGTIYGDYTAVDQVFHCFPVQDHPDTLAT